MHTSFFVKSVNPTSLSKEFTTLRLPAFRKVLEETYTSFLAFEKSFTPFHETRTAFLHRNVPGPRVIHSVRDCKASTILLDIERTYALSSTEDPFVNTDYDVFCEDCAASVHYYAELLPLVKFCLFSLEELLREEEADITLLYASRFCKSLMVSEQKASVKHQGPAAFREVAPAFQDLLKGMLRATRLLVPPRQEDIDVVSVSMDPAGFNTILRGESETWAFLLPYVVSMRQGFWTLRLPFSWEELLEDPENVIFGFDINLAPEYFWETFRALTADGFSFRDAVFTARAL